MKLSELIRQGAKLRPQGIGDYITERGDGALCTCVLGAAYEALTGKLPPSALDDDGDKVANQINKVTDILKQQAVHPVKGYAGFVSDIVVDLNDNSDYTREDIADWIAKLEDELEQHPERITLGIDA